MNDQKEELRQTVQKTATALDTYTEGQNEYEALIKEALSSVEALGYDEREFTRPIEDELELMPGNLRRSALGVTRPMSRLRPKVAKTVARHLRALLEKKEKRE